MGAEQVLRQEHDAMSLVMSRACAHIDACSWAMFYRIAFLICAVNPIVCLVVSKVVPHVQTSSRKQRKKLSMSLLAKKRPRLLLRKRAQVLWNTKKQRKQTHINLKT